MLLVAKYILLNFVNDPETKDGHSSYKDHASLVFSGHLCNYVEMDADGVEGT